VDACIINKHSKHSDKGCETLFGYNTERIRYSKSALDRMIDEMVSGKCLREDYRHGRLTKVYYGLGDSGDTFLAQLARDRGYDTIQLLREAQMSVEGDAVVGNELIHLYEPSYSQTFLKRLDPFSRPFDVQYDTKPNFSYLLDKDIKSVKESLISYEVFDPYEDKSSLIDVLVKRR